MKISPTKHPIANALRLTLFVCLTLTVLVWVVFGQTLHHEFINFDDQAYVYENPAVIRGLNLDGVGWAFTHIVSANWHPVTMISHMVDCQIYGLNAGGHHLTNVLLHTAAVILLFLVLREMTGALWRSAFVAAVFAVHPLRVESVAWVAERKDVLSGVFFMLTLWAYARYTRHPFSWKRYLLVLFVLALGLMSKPMLVTLPFVLLLLDYWPLGRFENPNHLPTIVSIPRHLIVEKIPLLALTVVSCTVTMLTQQFAMIGGGNLATHLRIENAGLSYITYLVQLFDPTKLALIYTHPTSSISVWKVIICFAFLAVVSAGTFALRKKYPYMIVGWLWFLGVLVPVIGFVQVGAQAHADRYTYLPHIGLYILFTWIATELSICKRQTLLTGCMATVVIAALVYAAHQQTSFWKDSETIWRHTLAVTSQNYMGQYCMGVTLFNQGKVDEAIIHYRKGFEISPDNPLILNGLGEALIRKGDVDQAIACLQRSLAINSNNSETLVKLGAALVQKKQYEEAVTLIQKALAINPEAANYIVLGNAYMQQGQIDKASINYQIAFDLAPTDPNVQNRLASAVYRAGKLDDAINLYEMSLATKPLNADAEGGLGLALFDKQRFDEAILHWQKALAIQPNDAQVQNNLGNALMIKRRTAEAAIHFQKALELRPHYVEAESNLAWILATSGQSALRNGNKAVGLAEDANQLTGGENPMILRILAAAYAEDGKFEQATETVKQAIALMTNTSQARALTNEINLYQSRSPFHNAAPSN